MSPDDQLQEVMHVRVENETVETEPYFQRQSSSVSSHSHNPNSQKLPFSDNLWAALTMSCMLISAVYPSYLS